MISKEFIQFLSNISDKEDDEYTSLEDKLKETVIQYYSSMYSGKKFKIHTHFGDYEDVELFINKGDTRYILDKKLQYPELTFEEMLATVDIGLVIIDTRDNTDNTDNSKDTITIDISPYRVYTGFSENTIKYFEKYGLDNDICNALKGNGKLSWRRLKCKFNCIEQAKQILKVKHKFNDLKDILSIDRDIDDYINDTCGSVDILGTKIKNTSNLVSTVANYLSQKLGVGTQTIHLALINRAIRAINIYEFYTTIERLSKTRRLKLPDVLQIYDKIANKNGDITMNSLAEKNDIDLNNLTYRVLSGVGLSDAVKLGIEDRKKYYVNYGGYVAESKIWGAIIDDIMNEVSSDKK